MVQIVFDNCWPLPPLRHPAVLSQFFNRSLFTLFEPPITPDALLLAVQPDQWHLLPWVAEDVELKDRICATPNPLIATVAAVAAGAEVEVVYVPQGYEDVQILHRYARVVKTAVVQYGPPRVSTLPAPKAPPVAPYDYRKLAAQALRRLNIDVYTFLAIKQVESDPGYAAAIALQLYQPAGTGYIMTPKLAALISISHVSTERMH